MITNQESTRYLRESSPLLHSSMSLEGVRISILSGPSSARQRNWWADDGEMVRPPAPPPPHTHTPPIWIHACLYFLSEVQVIPGNYRLQNVLFSVITNNNNNNNNNNGNRREKTCLRWFANNTGADQPAHPRSLISAFVIVPYLSLLQAKFHFSS